MAIYIYILQIPIEISVAMQPDGFEDVSDKLICLYKLDYICFLYVNECIITIRLLDINQKTGVYIIMRKYVCICISRVDLL